MYNFINGDISIDFKVPKDIEQLMNECELCDKEDDYPKYMNLAEYLVYVICKEAYVVGHLTKKQWETIEKRYPQ